MLTSDNFELSRLRSESAETILEREVGVSDSEARGVPRSMDHDIVRSLQATARDLLEASKSQHIGVIST